ncbi:GNAT family N-acetyltransferase [Bacillus timonensis]|nr:GNAT family N-acetyltransferase [Bacillus timonensis]
MKLNVRALDLEMDFNFFEQIVHSSYEWKERELGDLSIPMFFMKYERYNGKWLVWYKNDIKVAITYHVEIAPSNQKPWLGTILVHNDFRNKGIAKTIITELSAQLKAKEKKALFCGIPIESLNWSLFLGKCGFEQLKIEQEGEHQYLILVKENV